jgi:hypothetical protein
LSSHFLGTVYLFRFRSRILFIDVFAVL